MPDNSKFYEFLKGDLGEGYPWRVIINSSVSNDHRAAESAVPEPPCPHCHSPIYAHADWEKERKLDGKWDWTLPRGVSSLNEGGCNGTFVCADCILDGLKKIESGEVQPTKE